MNCPVQSPASGALPREGSLDDVGAVLCAIVRLTSSSGGLNEEDKRAVYSLSCVAQAEWRLLDAADDMPKVQR